MLGEPLIRRVTAADVETHIEPLTDLLIDCVDGGASVGFMSPLSREKAGAFWRGVSAGVVCGERALLVAQDDAGRVLGTVQLIVAMPDNQPHRADVAKMLVHRSARRRGIAGGLLAALDELAMSLGRSVLVLDTVTGGDAERLYARSGWQRVGSIPKYALMPDGASAAPRSSTSTWERLRRAESAHRLRRVGDASKSLEITSGRGVTAQ